MRDFIIRLEKNTIEIYHEYICGAYDYPILNMLKKKLFVENSKFIPK